MSNDGNRTNVVIVRQRPRPRPSIRAAGGYWVWGFPWEFPWAWVWDGCLMGTVINFPELLGIP